MTKIKLKQLLYTTEVNFIGIISNSLVHSSGKATAMKQCKAEIRRISAFLGLERNESLRLFMYVDGMYDFVSKRVFVKLRKAGVRKQSEVGYAETLRARQDIVYDVIRREVIYRNLLERRKNKMADMIETRMKSDSLDRLLESRASPFFLCSSHANPAHDHEDWEGKLYFDENWESYITDPDMQKRIRAVIRNRKLYSVQWVTGAPVWLVARKNCRHYFIPIPVEEVLSASTKSLLRRHNLYMPDEIPESYEHAQYRAYYERLKALEHLQKISPSDKLDKDIKNTRILVKQKKIRIL